MPCISLKHEADQTRKALVRTLICQPHDCIEINVALHVVREGVQRILDALIIGRARPSQPQPFKITGAKPVGAE